MKSPLYADSEIENATRKAYNFLDAQPDHGVEFLRKNNQTVHGLVNDLLENPKYLEETAHMSWLPVIKVEDNTIFVKTIRGIEPCRKANLNCEEVETGDLALCKSVRNNLFMISHFKEEVMA